MHEEWGPWVEHDGGGYPVPAGTTVEVMRRCGAREIVTVLHENQTFNAWNWNICQEWPEFQVIRYRIRKPRGLQMLEALLADLPALTPARQPEFV